MSYVNPLLRPDEFIVHRTKLHWIIFIVPGISIFLGLSLLVSGNPYVIVVSSLPLLWAFLHYKTSEFAVTNKRIIGKIGIIQRQSLEVLLPKVEGIQIDQSILGRMLNYGTIVTRSASTPIRFPHIANPIQVRRSVDEQLHVLEKIVH